MKLRKRKSDRTVSLDEPHETEEDTVTREIAVWDDDPEKKFSREELRDILQKAVDQSEASFPHRFRTSRHRRIVDRGDC